MTPNTYTGCTTTTPQLAKSATAKPLCTFLLCLVTLLLSACNFEDSATTSASTDTQAPEQEPDTTDDNGEAQPEPENGTEDEIDGDGPQSQHAVISGDTLIRTDLNQPLRVRIIHNLHNDQRTIELISGQADLATAQGSIPMQAE